MRIAYGVHGYGRGHAMRALAVLPELVKRHQVMILAGGDAYEALVDAYVVQRIPTLRFHYSPKGKISTLLTLRRNLSAFLDLKCHGPALDMVENELLSFQPDVVLADSEAFTFHAAAHLRIPRISFDRFGMLVYCKPSVAAKDRLSYWRDAFWYRRLYGRPDRIIVSSFFTATPRESDICVVGSVIREEVRAMKPSRGDHLLVYFSNGENEFTPAVEQALLICGVDCRVYGTQRRGLQGNLQFKPIANVPFLEDLASCRAVFSTTGNQLLGEVLYFRKPILGMPHDCFEQRINSRQIEVLGIGQAINKRHVTADRIRNFVAHVDQYESNMRSVSTNGTAEALKAIERFATELVRPASGTPHSTQATHVRT